MRKMILAALVLGAVLAAAASVSAQQWEYIGVVSSDLSRDETCVLVEVTKPVQVGKLIMIESRDGLVREVYEVRHVYGHNVILEQRVQSNFVSGSRVFQ